MVAMNFQAGKHQPNTGGMDIFETGTYTFQIDKSELKQTKAGTGTMLIFSLRCMEPELNGKRFTLRLNVQNPNPTAVEIAMGDLCALSYVVGMPNWSDTQQLHGRPFKLRLEKAPRSDNPEKFGNETRGFLDMNEQEASAQPMAAPAPAPMAAPAPAPMAAPAPAPMTAPAPAPMTAPAPVPMTAPPAPSAANAPPWSQQ